MKPGVLHSERRRRRRERRERENALRALGRLFRGSRINICRRCVRMGDVVRGTAGDYSVCDRCGASITSRTGYEVDR